MPINPMLGAMIEQTQGQGQAPPQMQRPPQMGQAKPPTPKKDAPIELDHREKAVIAQKFGTVRDFQEDETAYFRLIEDFKRFAAELGVSREMSQDPETYIASLSEAADLYARAGRLDEMKEAARSGATAAPY